MAAPGGRGQVERAGYHPSNLLRGLRRLAMVSEAIIYRMVLSLSASDKGQRSGVRRMHMDGGVHRTRHDGSFIGVLTVRERAECCHMTCPA